MFVVVFGFHVFVELILGVQSVVEVASVYFLDVAAADGSRAFGLPLVDVAGASDFWIEGEVQSWLRMFSLFLTTQSDSFWYWCWHLVDISSPSTWMFLNWMPSREMRRALLANSIDQYKYYNQPTYQASIHF